MSEAKPRTTPLIGISSAALNPLGASEICQMASTLRFDGVEWSIGTGQVLQVGAPSGEVHEIAQAGAVFGLQCCGVSVHDGDALLRPDAQWEWLAETATALESPHIRVYAPPVTVIEKLGDFDTALGDLQVCIAERADRLSRYKLKLLIEPSPRTLVPSPDLARNALTKAERAYVGVVYDPGSLVQEGWLDPFLAVKVLGRSLQHVHVKNVLPTQQSGRWTWTYERLLAGFVDWEQVVHAVEAAGYLGWYVLDHLSSGDPGAMTADLFDLRELLAPVRR